jgi:hypothetical protein
MRSSMSLLNRFVFLTALLLILLISLSRGQTVLTPVEDVFIRTFGGGEGCNPFLKYDISSIPGGATIDSVFLTPFVWEIGASWDGDVDFWNVNDQNWTEGDSARLIWNLPTSDSTYQASGFGTAMGWTRSVDLKNIFLTDYNASNTFCSIKIKDCDDMTSVPPPGSYPVNDTDTVAVGNIIFNEYMIFYSHEYVNGPPYLIVFYHEVGVNETEFIADAPLINIYPNPFKQITEIKLQPAPLRKAKPGMTDNRSQETVVSIKVYDISGRLVKSLPSSNFSLPTSIMWDATDNAGCQVPAGIYFCKIEAGEQRIIKKICLIK